MCGIVGYVGTKNAVPILLNGLTRLEYRGYDSAGLAVIVDNAVIVRKQAGRIANLRSLVSDLGEGHYVGIGHTRWATHGPPNDTNAHPHCDCSDNIAVVHNGIIENYVDLKKWLLARGHEFESDTDTEVIPHLIEELVAECGLEEAIARTAEMLTGAYALVIMSQQYPDRLYVVRQSSPLVIGAGAGETLVASDIPALLHHTNKVVYLEDGDVGVIRADGFELSSGGKLIDRQVHCVDWTPEQAEKGGMDHFMLKEIYEQPEAIAATLRGRIGSDGKVSAREMGLDPTAEVPGRIRIVACGTAYHAGLVGKHMIEKLARIPVDVQLASEFRYDDPIILPDDLVIAISQSGETADTLASIREAKQQGARVVVITNVMGSSAARETSEVVYTRAGPEVAVAATKTYTCQISVLLLLALYLAEQQGACQERLEAVAKLTNSLPDVVTRALTEDRVKVVEALAERIAGVDDCFYLGRGVDYAVVQEGQLKMKEISYVHAEALAAGELKHGTLALISDGVIVVASVTQPGLYEKVDNNLAQVKARCGRIVVVVTDNNNMFNEHDLVVRIPDPGDPLLAPIVAAVPLQLLAYYTGVKRGCDVDKPRNLAKSVTVE